MEGPVLGPRRVSAPVVVHSHIPAGQLHARRGSGQSCSSALRRSGRASSCGGTTAGWGHSRRRLPQSRSSCGASITWIIRSCGRAERGIRGAITSTLYSSWRSVPEFLPLARGPVPWIVGSVRSFGRSAEWGGGRRSAGCPARQAAYAACRSRGSRIRVSHRFLPARCRSMRNLDGRGSHGFRGSRDRPCGGVGGAGGPERRPGSDGDPGQAYTAALPIFRGDSIQGVLLVVGSSRDPFAVLDTPFLLALGHQVGAALANADMYQKLEDRKAELERLATRMVHHQEEERRRLSRELHDESAQVFAAVKLQLGMARESAAEEQRPALDRAMDLVGSGIRSIRAVARNLRPSLLDDLGLLPALRALGGDFSGKMGIPVTINAPGVDTGPLRRSGAGPFPGLAGGPVERGTTFRGLSCRSGPVGSDGTRLTLTVSDTGPARRRLRHAGGRANRPGRDA